METPEARNERRILICTPHGKDARLACEVLEGAGLLCFVCLTIDELVRELHLGASAILAIEEVLSPATMAPLCGYLASQPSWSDLPILVLTKPGGDSPWIAGAYERLGNLTLLERPVRTPALISAARSALRARQRQYEIRLADQRKDEFLAMLAHELRNPLAPISAAAQVLEIVASDPRKVKQSSAIISRQARHMTNLIDDLLDVARVTRGMIDLDQEKLDVRNILTEAVEQVTPLIRARRHTLSLRLSPDSAIVWGDRKRLIQVVVNLLNNASKYTPEKGRLDVDAQALGETVVLSVSDNGIGMEPAMAARVFDLFAQAERSSDRAQGGLGLGLALVKSLVASHGGSVEARSAGLGKGSTFTVRLPRLPDARPAEVVQTAAGAALSPVPLRVLVVDDNVDAADSLAMLLKSMGHEVRVEYSAAGALESARRTLPHVCLLDIGMPEIDGYELAQALRSRPEGEKAVLVAVTGYGQEQDRYCALSAGFDHHFVKPVDMSRLTAVINAISPS